MIDIFKNTGPWGQNTGGSDDGGSRKNGPGKKGDMIDIDEFLRKKKEEFGKFFGSGKSKKFSYLIIILVIFLGWLASGVYEVDAGEQGVVMRFGAYNRFEKPGLRYHLPSPIEKVIIVPVEKINTEDIGSVSSNELRRRRGVTTTSVERKALDEGTMLTYNRNIAIVPFSVNWKIKNAKDYLFNVKDPQDTIRSVAASAMREVVAQSRFIDVIAQGKEQIIIDARVIMQQILDEYKTGIQITQLNLTDVQPPEEVKDAMDDVNGAIQDRNKQIEQAKAYRNDVIPRARGAAQKLLEDALAYEERVVAIATGEAERFLKIYTEYIKDKDVTRKRLYLETMEEILDGSDKVILDSKSSGTSVVPYMALPSLDKKK